MQQTIRALLRRSLIQAIGIGALATIAGAPAGRAQTKRPMTLVDLVGYSRVGDPQLSQDGTHLLYMLSQADWKAGSRTPHIWRQDVGGGAPVQLTFGESGEGSPRWSPDGKTILFLRGGQAYLLPSDGGEARQLTKHATNISAP